MVRGKLYRSLKTLAVALGAKTRRGETRGWERFARTCDGNHQRLLNASNEMERSFYRHDDRVAHKWHDYLAAYDRAASRFRGKPAKLLEIGVCHGGSLQIWKDYLGDQAVLHGIEILQTCQQAEEDRIHIHHCDTADPQAVLTIAKQYGPFDIVVDDGSHFGSHQQRCFEAIFPHLNHAGVYIVEDLQCSYWSAFKGGYKRRGTFVEYCKDLLDRMHVWYISDDRIEEDEWFARNIRSITFSDGLVAIEKGPKDEPFHVRVGQRSLPIEAEIERLKGANRWLAE